MKDRTTPTLTAPAVQPIPMPGRLAVDYFDDVLKTRKAGRLDQMKPGIQVAATGVFTRVRYLDPRGGRVHALLTDDNGDSALVDFPPGTVALIVPLLVPGTRVTVVGLVQGRTATNPPSIDGYNARIAEDLETVQDAVIAGALR